MQWYRNGRKSDEKKIYIPDDCSDEKYPKNLIYRGVRFASIEFFAQKEEKKRIVVDVMCIILSRAWRISCTWLAESRNYSFCPAPFPTKSYNKYKSLLIPLHAMRTYFLQFRYSSLNNLHTGNGLSLRERCVCGSPHHINNSNTRCVRFRFWCLCYPYTAVRSKRFFHNRNVRF